MRAVAAALIAVAVVGASPRPVHACAGCRNPSLPITRLSNVHLASGQLRASAMLSATGLNVVHEAGCVDVNGCHEVPVQPRYLHDQDIYPGELRAVLELGMTSSWGVEAQVPFRLTHTTIRYSTPERSPYTPLDPDVHHRNETLAGLGDPWLLARFGAVAGGVLITARAGVAVPLGRTEEDPFALGAEGKRHQHVQFGNGTFDPVLMLDASRAFGRLQLSAYGQAQVALYESRKGFRAGNRYFTGLQVGTPLLWRVVGAVGVDVLHEGAERWGGKVQQDGNLGRTELLAGLSLTRPFGATLLSLVVRVPVYRHIVQGDEPPGELSSPGMLSLIVSHTF
jgi:hypothetical protein